MDNEDVRISKHSSGVSIIIRLDQIWKNCHSFKRNGQYQKWSEELDSVWLELSRDLFKKKELVEEDSEFKKVKQIFDSFDKEIENIGQIQDSKPAGFDTTPPDFYIKRNRHYKLLMRKQEFLGRLENYLGKGTTEQEDEGDWD